MTTQKKTARGTYIVEVEYGDGMSMSTGKFGKTVRAVVKFDLDGEYAARGPMYFTENAPNLMKANAGRTAKAYQRYYDQTGNRWELELKAKKQAKIDARNEERRKEKLVREAAPEMLKALQHALKRTGPDAVIEAALAKALG